jgi:hypothetical protein
MTVTLSAFGAFCTAIAILGGGVEVGGVRLPRLGRWRAVALGTFGIVVLVGGLLADWGASLSALGAVSSRG